MALNLPLTPIPLIDYSENQSAEHVWFPNGATVYLYDGDGISRMYNKSVGTRTLWANFSLPYPTQIVLATSVLGLREQGIYAGSVTKIFQIYRVLPQTASMKNVCWLSGYDTTYFNHSAYPLVVYFRALTHFWQVVNPVKYNDNNGTVIPLRYETYDTITFDTAPINPYSARLIQTISEWDNVTFNYYDKDGNVQSLSVIKTADAFSETRFDKTNTVKMSGMFIIK